MMKREEKREKQRKKSRNMGMKWEQRATRLGRMREKQGKKRSRSVKEKGARSSSNSTMLAALADIYK